MAQPQSQAKFQVLKLLGKGSYGKVFKVQRLADGGLYAMKETDLGAMTQAARADAVNEIRLLGSLAHPNVVRHHETFLQGSKLCIVMEFAPAGDLDGFIRTAAASRLPLPEATVWQILLQLCQGMQAIHETAVIHRDLKPANIFMCPGNVVKIGDLGVAKALTKANFAKTIIGTPVFMAPEVWRGLRYDYSSDLWSLGGVLYQLMTYRLPFNGRTIEELKNVVIAGRFVPLAPGAPYSPALVAVAHALLSRDPGRRPTCAAILNSSEAAPWLATVPEAVRLPLPPLDSAPSVAPMMPAAPGGGNLLATIHVPRDIRLLPHKLPKPSYGSNSPGPAAPAAGGGAEAAMAAAAAAAAAGNQRSPPAATPLNINAPAAAAAAALRAPSPRQAAAAPPAAAAAAVRAAAPSPRGYVPPGNYVSPAAAAAAGRMAAGGGVVRPSGGAAAAAVAAAAGAARSPGGAGLYRPGLVAKGPTAAPGVCGAGLIGQVAQVQQRVPSARAKAAMAGAGVAGVMNNNYSAAPAAKHGMGAAAAGVAPSGGRRGGFY